MTRMALHGLRVVETDSPGAVCREEKFVRGLHRKVQSDKS